MTRYYAEIRTYYLPDDKRVLFVLSHGRGLLEFSVNIFFALYPTSFISAKFMFDWVTVQSLTLYD